MLLIEKIFTSKYLFFISLSLLLNIIVAVIMSLKNSKIKVKTILKCSILETIGIIIGAKLLDIITNYDVYLYYINNELYFKALTNGYSFLGGIFGAVFCIFIYSLVSREKVEELCEIFIPNLLLVYSTSKLGCFFNGCCAGISINGYVLPIQLIETFVYLSIYLFVILKSKSIYSKIYLSCILFGISRFFLEFFREKTSYMYLSISQVLSIFIVIIGISIYYYKVTNFDKIIDSLNKTE